MYFLCIINLLFITSYGQTVDETCQERIKLLELKGVFDSSFNKPCLSDPCDSKSRPFNTTSKDCPAYCGIRNGKCLSKVLRFVDAEDRVRNRRQSIAAFQKAAQDEMSSFSSTINARSYVQIDGSGNSAGPGRERHHYLSRHKQCEMSRLAFNCAREVNSEEVLLNLTESPVDIPYCLRIPCYSGNAEAEIDFFACQSNPGCYFDQELAYRRQGFAAGALPGVPVCHQAIQNHNFIRIANAFSQITNKPWNTLYTNCVIEQNLPVMRQPQPGCHALKLLHSFDLPSKIAGWKGISEMDCVLINGCYFPEFNNNGYNCFYPAKENPSFTAKENFNEDEGADVPHGRQICQIFNTDTPQSYLDSYHKCKLSGCVVDESVSTRNLQSQFLSIILSKEVSSHARPQAWNQVKSGIITPGNWKEKLKEFDQCNMSQPQSSNTLYNSHLASYNENLFRAFVRTRQSERMRNSAARNFRLNPTSRAFPLSICDILSSRGNSLTAVPFSSTIPPTPGIIPFVVQYPLSSVRPNINPSFYGRPNQLQSNFQEQMRPIVNPTVTSVTSHRAGTSTNQGNSLSSNSFISLLRRASVSNQVATNVNLQNPILGLLCRRAHSSPGCPYQDLNFENYPRLKGRFNGCCETHRCYIKKANMVQQYSGPSAYWSRFGEWTRCNATCGGGSRRRSRICEKPFPKSTGCLGSAYQTGACNQHDCSHWSLWSEYIQCSVTCGIGQQTRSRRCVGDSQTQLNLKCKGERTQSKPCNRGPCPVYGPWSNYGECACGGGVQTRQRQCIANCDQTEATKYDQRECERFCGTVHVVNEGQCNPSTCSKLVTYECQSDNSNEVPHCFDFVPQRNLVCFNPWPCYYCPKSFSLPQCQAYLFAG